MHFTYGTTPTCLLLLLSTCQARRELSLFRVDDGDPADAHAPERRAIHASQAAMFGDVSPSPKKNTDTEQQDDYRETYRSEEARLQKERREMFFRNLGVGFGGSRSGGSSMSMGAINDDPISSGLESLSFSMDIVSEIEFGSLDDFQSSGPSTAGSADDLSSGDVGTSTGATQSSEESEGTPKVGAPVVSEPHMSTWQEVKAKLLGSRVDVQALKTKALEYAEEQKASGIQQAGANVRSVEMPWDDPDRPYDDLKAKALILAAETKNKLATEHERVQVRRRMLADGS